MKTPKRITKINEVKAGLYIRVDLNCMGEVILHTERIVGRPYKKNGEYRFNTCNFDVYLSGCYFNDLTVYVYCFKYTAKLFCYLKKLSKDKFAFLEFIRGKRFDEPEKHQLLENWDFEKIMDKMLWGSIDY